MKYIFILLLVLTTSILGFAQKQVVKNADGTVTLVGSIISTPASITLTANAGSIIVTNRFSAVTVTANSIITPSLTDGGAYNAGANGQAISVKVTNGQAGVLTLQVNNSGTDYTVNIPAGKSPWITYVSNGTDWIPTMADPAAGTVASTSLIYGSVAATRVDETYIAADLVSAALTATPATVAQGGTNSATVAAARVALNVTTNAVSASDIDWSLGATHSKTLAANSTFTFSNAVDGETIIVKITNTASNYTVTWPTVSWAGSVAPTQTVGAKVDVYTFVKIGSTIFGSAVQNLTP